MRFVSFPFQLEGVLSQVRIWSDSARPKPQRDERETTDPTSTLARVMKGDPGPLHSLVSSLPSSRVLLLQAAGLAVNIYAVKEPAE